MLGTYISAGSGTTKLLLHLEGNSTDTSGNNNSGSDTAITYSLANGKFGQGAGFNGSSSSINTPTPMSFAGTVSYTWVAWINTTSLPAAGHYIQIMGRDNRQVAGGPRMELEPDGKCAMTREVSPYYCYSISGVADGKWNNIIGTYNGVTLSIYINGKLENSATIGSTTEANVNFAIGAGYINSSIGTNYFNGSIDEVIIENRAWSAAEISKYYTYSKGRFGIT